MTIEEIVKEIDKVSRTIPTFIDPKILHHKKCYEMYYKIFLIIKKCVKEYYLTEKEIDELQTLYYSIFISLLYNDSDLYYLYVDYNRQFIDKLINLLEMYDYFEACLNIMNIEKIKE